MPDRTPSGWKIDLFNNAVSQHPFDRRPRDAVLLLHLCPMRNLEWKGIPMV
jgi:hypothetical protein